jgi:hypothetical protein
MKNSMVKKSRSYVPLFMYIFGTGLQVKHTDCSWMKITIFSKYLLGASKIKLENANKQRTDTVRRVIFSNLQSVPYTRLTVFTRLSSQ